jgi:UV DNA damage endonuclease
MNTVNSKLALVRKVGFACKWQEPDGSQVLEHNTRSTTVTKLLSLKPAGRCTYLHDLVQHNTTVTRWHLEQLAAQPTYLRMMRLSSDMLPLFTHEAAQPYYASDEFKNAFLKRFAWLGTFARSSNIRLSFHPGQYTTLVSVKDMLPSQRGIAEFEYHARVAEFMGYTDWHKNGFAINIHMGGRDVDAKTFVKVIKSLSHTARNNITIENDEFSWHTPRVLEAVSKVCPIVLDVHHHWINSGAFIEPDDALVAQVCDSWRGTRPKLHLALSRQELFKKPAMRKLPDLSKLLASGYTKVDLRSHSDDMWHPATLDYVNNFVDMFDVMVECKTKNRGQQHVARYLNLKDKNEN